VKKDSAVIETFLYDANGNRTMRQSGNAVAETASYDGQDRLMQRAGIVHQSDAAGFQTQRGTDAFVYSATGELLQATANGITVTYAYDGLRRRVGRTEAGGTTQYFYGNPRDDLQLTHSRDAAGVLTTYFYDDARRLFAIQRGASRYYIATDQLGSPRVVSDATGALVKVMEYDAFGTVVADSARAFDLVIGYAGGLPDTRTGIIRFGMRDYDPNAGRRGFKNPFASAGKVEAKWKVGLKICQQLKF